MFGRSTKLATVLGVSITTLFLAGVAGAKSAEAPKVQVTNETKQKAVLGGGETVEAGSRPEEAQARPDVTGLRTRDLDQQTRGPSGDLASSTPALGSHFGGDGARSNTELNSPAAPVPARKRETIRSHRDSHRASGETLRQLDRKKKGHKESQGEQQARAEELQRHGGKLEVSVAGSGSKTEQMEGRIAQLKDADRAGLFERPPASDSGGGSEMRERELGIVTGGGIVARPVEPIPYERYVQIYKASAKRYEFAKDWYVLAAVGKVESNHGENMGPSSAGAMGPMQFLPSTWEQYGVDGNGDGIANIMDPEDAIPAAAAYLEAGGAPEDWYAALYTYNRDGWYVREVLGIAEGYRRQAGDEEVEPYA